jgi:ATP-dependent helicase/nuclease subunit A
MSDDLLTQDTTARRAAQTYFDRPVVLEAGAGTGKTTTLVARVLSWTLGPGWNLEAEAEAGDTVDIDDHGQQEAIAARVLEGVAAITFTEAAAAEMAARVAEGLAAVADGRAESLPGFDISLIETQTPLELEKRARSLLGHLDRLEVRTIHAFCHSRLSAHPLELGLHPDFRIDPEMREIEATIRLVIEQRTKEAYASDEDSPLLEAAALGIGPQELAEALLQLTQEAVPARTLATDPFAAERLEATLDELQDNIDDFLKIAEELLHAVTRGANARLIATALERTRTHLAALDTRATGSATTLSEGLREIWPDNLLNHFGRWGKKGFNVSESEALGEKAEQLRPLCLPLRNRIRHLVKLEPARLETLRTAVAPLLAEAEKLLRTRGLTHFSHILIETRRLFENHPEVLASERRKIKQLLVDEFQDTDEVQCAIVSHLAFGDSAEDSPGLFVVGDPKQSIYGWRNADLEAYEAFLELVRQHEGLTYSLVQNFRSAPVLLEEVERSIRPVMKEQPGLQPRFTELLPSEKTRSLQGFRKGRWTPVESWVSWSPDALLEGRLGTSHIEAAEIESEAVARDIRSLHLECGVAWKDFGVLFRSTNRLDLFLEAFRRNGVPFVVTRDKQYFRRREIIEAAALVRLIVNPTDQVALLTFLRSPSVGVPDAALIPLWRRGFPHLVIDLKGTSDSATELVEPAIRSAAAELPDGIPGLKDIQGWEENLLDALATLAALRTSIREQPPDRFVESLRRTTLVEASEAARFLGQYRVANLERFFRRLQLSLEESGGDVQAVLRSLKRSVTEAQEAEEALPKDAAEDAVQVMTIHKAKGLEFPHVYLVQLDAESRRGETNPTDADRRWGTNGPEDYALFGSPTLGFDRVRERRERVVTAEQVRIFYVAMTRARDRLVLAGRWTDAPWKALSSSTPTFLSLLQQRDDLPGSIAGLATQALHGDGFVDAGGWRWKFPGLKPLASETRARGRKLSLPTKADVAKASRRLAELALEAQSRMQRPLLGRASLSDEERRDFDPDDTGRPWTRSTAQLVGIAVHRALEGWDFCADPSEEVARQLRLTTARLSSQIDTAELEAALGRVNEIFARFESGQLLRRLIEERDQIVARELPVLLPTGGEDHEPIAGVTGIIDLVLRDRQTEELIIVDYKTDEIENEATLTDRAAHYGPQLSTYAKALRQALGLEQAPPTELWFLSSDQVWRSS